MWLAPTCVAVAVGCVWVPKCVAMAIGCDWYLPTSLDGASWMWFVPACVAVAAGCDPATRYVGDGIVGCDWCHVCGHGNLDVSLLPTFVAVRQLDVGWCPRVWR